MAHDVFISHSSKDKSAADAVCFALEKGEIRCWIAPRDVVAGRPYSGQITRAVQASRVMIVVFSENANNSPAVLAEVELAQNGRLQIVNFRVDASPLSDDLAFYLQNLQWLDALTPPMERSHAQLLAAVRLLLPLNQTVPHSSRKIPAATLRPAARETTHPPNEAPAAAMAEKQSRFQRAMSPANSVGAESPTAEDPNRTMEGSGGGGLMFLLFGALCIPEKWIFSEKDEVIVLHWIGHICMLLGLYATLTAPAKPLAAATPATQGMTPAARRKAFKRWASSSMVIFGLVGTGGTWMARSILMPEFFPVDQPWIFYGVLTIGLLGLCGANIFRNERK